MRGEDGGLAQNGRRVAESRESSKHARHYVRDIGRTSSQVGVFKRAQPFGELSGRRLPGEFGV